MMRILHYYPDDDILIKQYVTTLVEYMDRQAENFAVNDINQALTLLQGSQFDILHIHGCWRYSQLAVVKEAFRHGVRLVYSPHGQLEPWIIKENYWKEKLPKKIYYQKRLIQQSYSVIIQGRMEQDCMERLGWNPRMVIIRNSLITHSITPAEMARQLYAQYGKVMDSNPLQLMPEDTRSALRTILMAGITGDIRWTAGETPVSQLSALSWRLLLLYVHQEHIDDIFQRGVRLLRLDMPDIDVRQAVYYLPDGYHDTVSIESLIGNSFTSENERLLATFRCLRKLIFHRQIAIRHLVELDRELRQHPCQEGALTEQLTIHKLLKTARRLMQLMNDYTGLTEGFMPVLPLNDRITNRIRKQIDNHLKI